MANAWQKNPCAIGSPMANDGSSFTSSILKENNIKEKKVKSIETPLPPDFCPDAKTLVWYATSGFKESIEAHADHFKDACSAHPYKYINWQSAFKNAVRKDWAGLRSQKTGSNSSQVSASSIFESTLRQGARLGLKPNPHDSNDSFKRRVVAAQEEVERKKNAVETEEAKQARGGEGFATFKQLTEKLIIKK